MKILRHSIQRILISVLLFGIGANVVAQELEPRRWAHIPIGANFLGVGYVYSDLDISLDPVLLIEDATADIHTVAVSYVRALDFFGKTGRIDIVAPVSSGRWEGLLDGEFAFTEREGFNDPKIRLAVNLVGPPAQRGKEFIPFQTGTLVGASLEVTVPLGEYDSSKLINLGTNRWTIRPQFGVVHSWKKWTAEVSASAWFYTDNDDLVGREAESDPLVALQGHLIYTFRPGLWASLSAAYGNGARSTVDGVQKDSHQVNYAWALSLGIPINRQNGLKLAFVQGESTKIVGVDYNRVLLAYSYYWGGR